MTIDKYYDIAKSKRINIPFMTNKEALEEYEKGWGYSFVYSLTEIRDIFLMVKQHGVKSIPDFREKYVVDKIPYSKSKWEERRVLEILNALINFGLIDKKYHVLKASYFSESSVGTPLTESEKSIFKEIYLNYFRFKELLLLYMNPELFFSGKEEIKNITEYNLVHNSNILYNFMEQENYVRFIFYSTGKQPYNIYNTRI